MKRAWKSSPTRINVVLGVYLLITSTLGVFRVGALLLSIVEDHPLLPYDTFPVSVLINNSHGFANNAGTTYLGDLTGELLFLKPPTGILIYSFFYNLILWASACYVIFLMMKIVRSISTGDSFTKENGTRLRIIGLMTLLIPSLLLISRDRILGSLLKSVKIQNLELAPAGSGETLIMFAAAGLFFLVLSEVFRIGTSLKDENELTV